MTEAHIVPGLSHASLISTRKFCDAGCKVSFDEDECRIFYKNRLVLTGDRDPHSQLWRLPINPPTMPTTYCNIAALNLPLQGKRRHNRAAARPITNCALNVYTIPHKQNQVKYMHQSFFNASIPTLLKAINNNQLEGIPLMKSDLIHKYLAKSPATSKGRMKRPRVGIRSTRKQKQQDHSSVHSSTATDNGIHPNAARTNTNLIPNNEPLDGTNNIFCYAALADKQTGTLYTDATGSLPARSLDGNQLYLVAYDYDTNYIFAVPVASQTFSNASIISSSVWLATGTENI